MRRDWKALREKYVQGRMTMQELAEAEKVPYRTITTRASKEGWTELREAFREAVAQKAREKAVKRRGRREAEALAALEETNEQLLDEIRKALEDEDQLYRHLVSLGKDGAEEQTLHMLNTVNLRNLVESLSTIQTMIAAHGNILDKRTVEELKLKKQRLKLDKQKSGLEDRDDGETGVAYISQVEEKGEGESLTLPEV